jgi:hypothetical protein
MKSIKAGDSFEFNKILTLLAMQGRLSGTDGYNKYNKKELFMP